MPRDSDGPQRRPDLELELGAAEVLLKHLVAVSGTFSQLLGEVARTYTGLSRDPVRWAVEVRDGSVRLPLHALPNNEEVHASAIREIPAVVLDGIAQLEEQPKRPDYFSDTALEQARTLANYLTDQMPNLSVSNGQGRVLPITKRLVANVEEVLGPITEAFGTVEGYLEALNIHGAGQQFNVYDALTGKAIPCYFGEYVTLDDVLPAVGKRVGARGKIKLKRNGERASIEAHSLTIFPEPEHLPTVDEVVGILRGYEEIEE